MPAKPGPGIDAAAFASMARSYSLCGAYGTLVGLIHECRGEAAPTWTTHPGKRTADLTLV